jgi:hypothetical protein
MDVQAFFCGDDVASAFNADEVFLEFGHGSRSRARFILKIREVTYAV